MQTPISVPLADKSKEELVRIAEMMTEDLNWYVGERNRLIAASHPLQDKPPAAPPADETLPAPVRYGETAGTFVTSYSQTAPSKVSPVTALSYGEKFDAHQWMLGLRSIRFNEEAVEEYLNAAFRMGAAAREPEAGGK